MKRLTLPLSLLAVVAISLAVNEIRNPATVHGPAKAKAVAVAVAADIGMKVRDGAFDFVVTGVEHPGKPFTGKVGKTLTAQGEFVIVRVDVTNVGTKAVRLSSSGQFLFNEKGQEFATSPAILSTKDALKYVRWINPGDTVNGASMLFDVAPGTKTRDIELHASQSSAGVKVKLS
ncbi:MAG TPA: DUF4352 domain-containing protein [Dermatophilaceae bacterium]